MRTANLAGALLQGSGLTIVGLDAEELLETARRRTGLEDFGNEDFRAPLETLLDSCEREAGLTLVGRLAARSYILQLLAARLRMHRDRHREPRIPEQAISRPIFITGLPRSGTTLLHGLFASDAANRVPLTWEVMFPSPPPRGSAGDPRIEKTDRLLGWIEQLAPEFKRIHPVGAMLPQECIAITAHDFASIEFNTLWRVPAYQSRLEHDEPRGAYRFHRRFLQNLQHGRAGERWVLKAPAHLFHLEALFAVYPDARVIQTHRDPLAVAASIASYGTVLRAAFSDAVDAHEVGTWMCEFWARGADRALDYRRAHGEREVLDVHFAELCGDPVATVRRLYGQLGMKLEPAAENAMRGYLAEYPMNRHGRHRYSLEQFGLEPNAVNERFAGYREAFDL
ncbi:MAG: sulfotransferase family protein [Gammaproteobacteria bacterium]